MTPFQKKHLLTLLEQYSENQVPIDAMLSNYFRANRNLGANDRRQICERLYPLIRWQGLIDHHLNAPVTWEKRLEHLEADPPPKKDIPPHIKVSFPKYLYTKIEESLGSETEKFCLTSNEEAPITVRVNTLKTTREALFRNWKERFDVSLSKSAPNAIHFHRRYPLHSLPEFKKGLFEIQDESSQQAASLLSVKPGDHVLDYCAGAGGKSLAIAPNMGNKGQLYLYDIRPGILLQAKKRLKRAGVQNFQILKKPKTQRKMDWLFLDVPCSGLGTLRRNPDLKWKITPEMIERLIGEQRAIFEQALPLLKPDGKIVYATCSVLDDENEKQVAYFCEKHHLQTEKIFKTLPQTGEGDGFFAAVLKTNS